MDWPTDPATARAAQTQLAQRVETHDRLGPVRVVAGVDGHHSADGTISFAAAVALAWPTLDLLSSTLVAEPARFPYVPGLLSFREAPAMLRALDRLPHRPDLLLVDGQGLAHPRGCGIACHLGVLRDLPAIGAAKSRLIGRFTPPPTERGALTPLQHRGATIGAAVTTRAHTRPLFVSVGHRVSLETAIAWVLATATTTKLPEPTKLADRLSRAHD